MHMPYFFRRVLFSVSLVASVAFLGAPSVQAQAPAKGQAPVDLNDTIDDPAVWGKLYPDQYRTYLKTVDQAHTKYGGSEAFPRSPTAADPRSSLTRSKLEQDPRLKAMWAGYAFSIDYRERRGHAYMLDDQTYTGRQKTNPPSMCINCHASLVTTYLKMGDGDLMKGFDVFAKSHMPYPEIRRQVQHPVACIDCHDPQTMQLRITRPAFIEGIRALKASQGVKNYDVNTMATREEMRSYVCGQCHVTYYFKGPDKRLTYPWDNGLKVENIITSEEGVNEWVHPDTGAKLIKPRHPEFEMWNQGVHGKSGVACVDCHMPEMKENGKTFTDHQVNSPLLKIDRACTGCHKTPPAELKARVEDIQDRYFDLRNHALDALMDLIGDIKAARTANADARLIEQAQTAQRKGQFMIDFIMSENSMGFHAPEESLRILGDAINQCRMGQLALHGAPVPSHTVLAELPAPVVSH
ncbi:MAG: ammonia-forming cytochrome c nitrite reductase subunit c552 [Acidobacteriota bacterium]|nr:ammonia-forming cytochrome c nitrite reductase subunit c552 [Acidobacteriota bacterium]